jgi:hypothetical protein
MTKSLLFMSFAALTAVTGWAAEAGVNQSGFAAGNVPQSEWQPWAARAEIAPKTSIAADRNRGEPGALMIAGGGNASAYGGWQRVVDGITESRII